MTTRLVEVNVIARNKKGELVTDLTRDEFILRDKGHEEPISHFSAISSGDSGRLLSHPLPPNTFSNRVARLAGATSVTAILFDGLNTRVTDQTYAREQIVEFLRHLQPGDQVAIYALGRGLNVLQDFTSDSGMLIRAIENYQGDLSAEATPAARDTLDPGVVQFRNWLSELRLNLVDHYARDRSLRTIRSLVAIANHVERLPGRKNLVWVSGSFPVWIGRESVPLPARPTAGVQTFRPEVERAARALDSANLAIYPVDARGLMAPVAYEPHQAAYNPGSRSPEWSKMHTMEQLAARTGGRAFFNNNDLVRAFHAASTDSRHAYILGFQPSHEQWNGKFRPIKVRVKRKGVRLQYRAGYFAQPTQPSDQWYRSGVLDAAMWSPVEATRLGFTVRPAAVSNAGLDLEIQIDPHDLALLPSGDTRTGELEVRMVQIGRADRFLKSDAHIARLRLPTARYAQLMRSGSLPLLERITRAPGAALLRVLVYDVNSGALGSVNIPLEKLPASPIPAPPPAAGADRTTPSAAPPGL